jgi:hypothetical protein
LRVKAEKKRPFHPAGRKEPTNIFLGFLFQNIDMGISKNKPFGILRFDSQGPLLIKCIFRNPGLSISEKRIMNRLTVVRIYSGDLAGTPVPACRNSCFFDPGFSGSIKHLECHSIRFNPA